jgi:hypothetical protein
LPFFSLIFFSSNNMFHVSLHLSFRRKDGVVVLIMYTGGDVLFMLLENAWELLF